MVEVGVSCVIRRRQRCKKCTGTATRIRFLPNSHPRPFPLISRFLPSSPLSSNNPSSQCQHADANVSSSQNHPRPFSRLQSPTLTRRSIIYSKRARYLKLMSLSNLFFFNVSYNYALLRAYAARMSFYRLKQFQCEVTGKSGLDYFQALESEQQEAQTMHSRFPEPLKAAVLKAVQWRASRLSFAGLQC